jgi:hypothetical protein
MKSNLRNFPHKSAIDFHFAYSPPLAWLHLSYSTAHVRARQTSYIPQIFYQVLTLSGIDKQKCPAIYLC